LGVAVKIVVTREDGSEEEVIIPDGSAMAWAIHDYVEMHRSFREPEKSNIIADGGSDLE
jgi:hypothetical protein